MSKQLVGEMIMENKALNFAKYITILLSKDFDYISNTKIQKLLWYCQILWFVKNEKRLFVEENFYAWTFGVVIPEIWYQRDEIKKYPDYKDEITALFAQYKAYKEVIEEVVRKKGKWTGAFLSAENHEQKPWEITYDQKPGLLVEWDLIKKHAEDIYQKYLT